MNTINTPCAQVSMMSRLTGLAETIRAFYAHKVAFAEGLPTGCSLRNSLLWEVGRDLTILHRLENERRDRRSAEHRAAKAAKNCRHAANLAARRAADRERSTAQKSGGKK